MEIVFLKCEFCTLRTWKIEERGNFSCLHAGPQEPIHMKRGHVCCLAGSVGQV